MIGGYSMDTVHPALPEVAQANLPDYLYHESKDSTVPRGVG